jgi:hypothetical protein
MKFQDNSFKWNKKTAKIVRFFSSFRSFLKASVHGFTLFEIVFLFVYSAITVFFLFAALYLLITEGFN